MTEKTKKPPVDWELIGIAYRAGVQTVRQIAADHGVSHTAIQKRAAKEGWTRDLSEKVQGKAKELVAKAEVAKAVAMETKVTEQVATNVLAQKVADIDLADRSDLQAGIDLIRSLGHELALLSKPEFQGWLEELGEVMDESYTKDNGAEVKDKFNELYRYIVSLSGRIKMVKDLASAVNVYTPLRRKVVGLDVDKGSNEIDELLKRVRAEKESKA